MSTQVGPRKLSDISTRFWKGLVYGPPGVGKSIFSCGSKSMRTFVIDVDDGMNSVHAHRIRNKMSTDLITVWTIQSVEEFDKAVDYAVANLDKYDLVVVDSATELQRLVVKEVSEAANILVPGQREWGIIRTLMENPTVRFRYLPIHFLLTAHEIYKFDPDFNRDVYRPSFDGRYAFEYAKHLSYICRYVIYHQKGPNGPDGKPTSVLVRALNFGPDPFCHYKDRSGMMNQWELPDIDAILEKMAHSTVPEED